MKLPEKIDEFISIEDVDVDTIFSLRTSNCLEKKGIKKISHLLEFSAKDLREIRNMSKKNISEIREYLSIRNLHLKGDILISKRQNNSITISIPERLSSLKVQILGIRDEMNKILITLEKIYIMGEP
jgi:hypothetical protein